MSQHHIPRKRFGQNFLINKNIIAAIIDCINPKPNDHIVEIGPGQAALTKLLIQSGARIDAIEIDRDLAEVLQNDLLQYKNFKLHQADILNFDLQTLLNNKNEKLRLVGNLPYNISTPLLFKLFPESNVIQDMFFMLQKEVAERLIAQPGCKEYGRLSIMAQYFCKMQIVLDVPPHAFNPAPKVDSSIIHLQPHQVPPVIVQDIKLLQHVTTSAFNHRRKTIANAVQNLISADELRQLQIDPSLRPENLSLSDYAAIANYLKAD